MRMSQVAVSAFAITLASACSAAPAKPATSARPARPAGSATSAVLTEADAGPAAVAAFKAATAVHVKGSVGSGAQALVIDMQLNKDGSSEGTLVKSGTPIQIRVTGGVTYVLFTRSVLTRMKLPSPPGTLLDKWVPSTSPIATSLASPVGQFVSYTGFLNNVLAKPGTQDLGPQTGTATINGTPVLIFTDSSGSKAEIDAVSPHYLLRLIAPVGQAGSIDFTGWNTPVPITAPPTSQIYHP